MHTAPSRFGRRRYLAGNILVYFGSIVLLGSAMAKIAQVPRVVAELGAMGFDRGKLIAIAILEITSALFFLYLPTRSLGLLLVSAYLGGAIATHVGHGSSGIQPAVVLSLLWLGAYLRHPVMLWSIPSHPEGPAESPLEVRRA